MPTVDIDIAASADDADLTDSLLVRGNTTVHIAADCESMWFRFLNVTVPKGATITAATLRLVGQSSVGSLEHQLYSQASDDAPALSEGEDGTLRTWNTVAANSWAPGALSAGSYYTSNDIADIIQAVTDRSGWASGNAMLIRVARYNAGAKGYNKTYRSYDNGSTPKLARLSITYSSGGKMNQTVIIA